MLRRSKQLDKWLDVMIGMDDAQKERDQIEQYFTDLLREHLLLESQSPQDAQKMSRARADLVEFLEAASAKDKLHTAIATELSDMKHLLSPEFADTTMLRSILAKTINRIGLAGIYKPLAALGKSFIGVVRTCLSEGSQDGSMESKVTELNDFMVIVSPSIQSANPMS